MDQIPLDPSFTWADARARGVTRGQIGTAGLELSRGLYLSRAEESNLAARCRAWTRLLPPDAAFGLTTAVQLLGADPPPGTEPTPGKDEFPPVHVVLRPRRVLPQRRGLAVHVRQLREPDVVEVDGLRVSSGPQTFLDLAPLVSPAELVAVGDALMRAGHLPPEALTERLARASRVRGVLDARACAPLLTPKADSRPESLIRYWLVTSDLPDPQPSLPVRDRFGRVVTHADLGYERWRLLLEYEGRQHADPDQFGRDVDRYSLAAADGWLVLRFAARHLTGPAVVVERTRRALLHQGWRPERAATPG